MFLRLFVALAVLGVSLARPQSVSIPSTVIETTPLVTIAAPDATTPLPVTVPAVTTTTPVNVDVTVPTVSTSTIPSVDVPTGVSTSISVDVTVPTVSTSTLPSVDVPTGVSTSISVDVTVPTVSTSTIPSVDVSTGVSTSVSVGGGQTGQRQSIQFTLRYEGYSSQAQSMEDLGLFDAIANAGPVTVIAVPNPVIDEIKQKIGTDIPQLTEFFQQLILWDMRTKAELLQKGLSKATDVLNYLNQALVPRAYPNGECVLSGGKIVRPDIPAVDGIIQGVNGFVRRLPKTIAQVLTDLGGPVKTLIDKIKVDSTQLYNDLNDATKEYTVIVPSITDIPNMINPINVANLANTLKSQYMLRGAHTPNDLAQMTNVTNAAGNQLTIRPGATPGTYDLGVPGTGVIVTFTVVATVKSTSSPNDVSATNGVVTTPA